MLMATPNLSFCENRCSIPPNAAASASPTVRSIQVLHDWIVTVDHKKLGLMYFMLRHCVPGDRRDRSHDHAGPVGGSRNNHLVSPADLQPHVHHAWHDHDFLRGHADRLRLRQLSGAADDRRARHGVSRASMPSASG